MATGGVFQLITNDGKQDRMLMATQMLRNRLDQVRDRRAADKSIKDSTPTLLDIERTHILFTNAHFKPFVAIGYEYNKVNTGAGTVQLGSDVQFSIPQFGDFIADMVLHVKLDAPVIDDAGETGANRPTGRWCDYPGERLLKEVEFEVNGNSLDTYITDATAMHRKFLVQPNKQAGWDRCMGQSAPKKAWLSPDSAGEPDDLRMNVTVSDGAQTPKKTPEGLEMLIPLLFWCNKDPRLAIPSVAIPFGQRFIKLKLATKDEMVGLQTRGTPTGTPTISTPSISTMTLYINNIFVNPEIHRIFIQRIGFSLIRVHRYQTIATSLSERQELLQNMKWPIEVLFVGLRPTAQKDSLSHWHEFTSVEEADVTVPSVLSNTATFDYVGDGSGAAVATASLTAATGDTSATVVTCTKTIDKVTVSAHGIFLYNDLPGDFFNNYTTYTYGGPNIRTPEDCGALMIPFCLYPGTYQPSGHVNVSRAREFYLKYTSSVIGKTVGTSVVSGELVVIASAINFLLISDGSAVLRYST